MAIMRATDVTPAPRHPCFRGDGKGERDCEGQRARSWGEGRGVGGRGRGAKEQLFQLYTPGSIERFIPENDSRIIVGLSRRHPGRSVLPPTSARTL